MSGEHASKYWVRVTRLTGSDSTASSYDANGNMTCRVEALNAAPTTWVYDGAYVFLPDREAILALLLKALAP